MRFTIVLSLILMVVAIAPVAGQESDAVAKRIEAVEQGLRPPVGVPGVDSPTASLLERMARYGVPGVSIAVINEGKIEWARGYGVLEGGGSSPVTPETRFQAASISKPVASMGALRLVQDGQLDLDENVNGRLTSWSVPENEFTETEKVTLRRLVTHTAGLTVHGFRGYAAGEATPSTIAVLDGAPPANSPPIRVNIVPGSRWRYSGGGFTVMQLMLEDVTGRPFAAHMQDVVLEPLGMTRSTFAPLTPDQDPDVAVGHRSGGEAVAGKWHTYPEMAAASLWTTPTDLARFAVALQEAWAGRSETVLDQEWAVVMLTPGPGDWGLGVGINGSGEETRFQHGGGNEGFRCILTAYRDGGQGVVIMTNSDDGPPLFNELMWSVAEVYDWPGFDPTQQTPGIAAVLDEIIISQDATAAVARYHELKRDHPGAFNFSEGQLNFLGYQYLQKGEVATAIQIFELNVEAFPDASNPHDSLGEAYMMDGQRERAIRSYERSIELNPENENGKEMLQRLREP